MSIWDSRAVSSEVIATAGAAVCHTFPKEMLRVEDFSLYPTMVLLALGGLWCSNAINVLTLIRFSLVLRVPEVMQSLSWIMGLLQRYWNLYVSSHDSA